MPEGFYEYPTRSKEIYLPLFVMALISGLVTPLIIKSLTLFVVIIVLASLLFMLLGRGKKHHIDEDKNELTIQHVYQPIKVNIDNIKELTKWKHKGAISFPVAFDGIAVITHQNKVYKMSVSKEKEFIAHIQRLNPTVTYNKRIRK